MYGISFRKHIVKAAAAALSAVLCLLCPDKSVMAAETGDLSQNVAIVNEDGTKAVEGMAVSFSYGFRNTAKSGRMLPFDAQITNNTGNDFTGKFIIKVSGSVENGRGGIDRADISYAFDIEAEDEETVSVRDTVSVSETAGRITLIVEDEAGNVCYERETELNLRSGNGSDILIGILSRHPNKLEYFKNVSISGTGLTTRTVELDSANLPETVSGFEQLDILLITDFDIDKLEDATVEAIEQWVDAGGVLLIGTGEDTGTALRLGSGIRELSVEYNSLRGVNMGLKYSKNNPDDAVLELEISDIFAASGIQVMQSDDIAMLTTVQQNNGIIGIAAYDFTDISDFCEEEAEYPDEIIRGLLGTSRLTKLFNNLEGSENLYNTAKRLSGMADADKLPKAAMYILFAIAYLCALAWIYMYLKSRGLSAFYHAFVPIAAFMSATVLWLLSSPLRNDGISVDYAAIKELHDGSSSERGFIKVSEASLDAYELTIPAEYDVHPVVHGIFGANANAAEPINAWDPGTSADEGGSAGDAEIYMDSSGEGTVIKAENLKPFAGTYLEYTSRTEDSGLDGIDISMSYFNGAVTGSIANNTSTLLKNSMLIMYGKLILIGDIAPGESVYLDELDVMEYPVGEDMSVAAYALRLSSLSRSGGEYTDALRMAGLLGYYMEDSMRGYFGGARFAAFTDALDMADTLVFDTKIKNNGCVLVTKACDVTYSNGIYAVKNCFETEPKTVSGDYDPASNTTTGSCTLEYSLGTDINISVMNLRRLSAEFETDELKNFSGSISFYNYQTGGYELINAETMSISSEDMMKYLSPGNTLTVRYTSDDETSGIRRLYLPVPEVSGTEKN